MKKAINYIIFLSSIILLTNCDDSPVSGEDVVFPENNISYTNHVEPFMRQACAYQGCHGGANPASGLLLSDYFVLTSEPGLIIPNNPDGSRLIQIMENPNTHITPFIRSDINENTINGMRQWILEGAKINP